MPLERAVCYGEGPNFNRTRDGSRPKVEIETLCAELEQLFELEELMTLSEELLGFSPDEVGGTAKVGSFAHALANHCIRENAVEALRDALIARKPAQKERFAAIHTEAFGPGELHAGDRFGPFTIAQPLGKGATGSVYRVQFGPREVRLKLLRKSCEGSPRGLQRFLTFSRLCKGISGPGTPKNLGVGNVDGRYYLVSDYSDGVPLDQLLQKAGALHVNDAAPIIRNLLDALDQYHTAGLTHGNLKPSNVLIKRQDHGQTEVVILDAGTDRLETRAPDNGKLDVLRVAAPLTAAPEIWGGEPSSAQSDIYAAGVLIYFLLTGKPPFEGTRTVDLMLAHLTEIVEPPSSNAPEGWISKALDEYVMRLLHRSKDARPSDADEALDGFEHLMMARSQRPPASSEVIEERITRLLANPTDAGFALALEAVAEDAQSALRVAETFMEAFDSLGDGTGHGEAKLNLAFRAGRLYRQGGDKEQALTVYARLLELEPKNRVALTAVEDLRRQLGRYEELVEMWLGQADSSEDPSDKAQAMAKIGALYDSALNDPGQALVAYTQAFSLQPEKSDYARAIERLAKGDHAAWNDVVTACSEAIQNHSTEDAVRLLLAMGRWYSDKLNRYDLALNVYQSILSNDAANEAAMEGTTQIYRRAQQWTELAQALKQYAALAKTPAHARELKCEAAEVFLTKLGQPAAAGQLLESVLDEDPSHKAASDGLAQLYENNGDFQSYVTLLERRAEATRGAERLTILCRVGEVREDRLQALEAARSDYQRVLAEDPTHLGALRGLDRVFTKLARYADLLSNLQDQVRLAATPRQKLTLLGRIASLYEEEFIDPELATSTYQEILSIDGRNEGALTALERLYTQQKRWHQAVDIYARHAEVVGEPKRKADLLLSRARVLHKQLSEPDLAIVAYSSVLELVPDVAEALSALAELRASAGDADEARSAIEALAETSHDAQVKADSYVKVAGLLEERGDVLGAIDRYRLALQAVPDHAAATDGLVSGLLKRNDVQAAAELLADAMDHARLPSRRARLSAELARLALERLGDDETAVAAANNALESDRSSAQALWVLSAIHVKNGERDEALAMLQTLVTLLDQLNTKDALTALFRYIDLLSEVGSTEAALGLIDTVRGLAPDDVRALRRVADVAFDHGDPAQARNLYTELLDRFEDELSSDERFTATYRRAEATLRSGQVDMGVLLLEEACDLDPTSPLPLAALAEGYAIRQQWERVWEIRTRLLDMLDGDERVDALVEMGELANDKLNDKHRAVESFVAALDERPGDRNLLARLMQLYSEEKDWSHVVEVVMKLAEFQEDPTQRGKYLMTAGMLSARELGEFDQALDCFARVMELDPWHRKAFNQSIDIHRNRGDFARLEKLLKTKMKAASNVKDRDTLLEMFDALGELYRELGRVEDGVDALEAAQTLDPDNDQRPEKLAQLYSQNTLKFFDKARAFHEQRLRDDPYRADSYKALRKLYTEAKNADGAWCLCQALYVLNLAGPDEERFFVRMRSNDPAYAQTVLGEEDWNLLHHPELDPHLTAVFAAIEPAVVEGRGQAFEHLGYDPYAALDLGSHHLQVAQTLFYAAGVMNQEAPPCFENPNDPGGLQFLPSIPPGCSIGLGLSRGDVGPQPLAFIAGQHLTYYRPGFTLRQLVATGTGLKSWLFAAIKLMSPQFPVAADVETTVQEALFVLRDQLTQPAKDELARAVSKLLQSKTALDLKRWVNAVDLTADRVGFLLAHDLETAMEVVRASEDAGTEKAQRRLKELVMFAISQPYLTLRARLLIDLQS
jgi:tetratricopeptide (TPR) repeat protein